MRSFRNTPTQNNKIKIRSEAKLTTYLYKGHKEARAQIVTP